MDKMTQIRQLLRELVGVEKPLHLFQLVEVVSVDGDVCTVKLDTLEIPDVRLSSIVGGAENGVLYTPAVGSVLLVADISCGELRDLVVLAYSEIDSIKVHKGKTTLIIDGEKVDLTVGNSAIKITESLVEFNGGTNKGVVKVADLVSKLNTLEKDINTLKTALAGWVPANPLETDGKALKLAITAWSGGQLATTVEANLVNDKFKH